MRICSLSPTATDIVCELGLGNRLIGRSHACTHCPALEALPEVIVPLERFRAASAALDGHDALYVVLEDRLRALEPDLVIATDAARISTPTGEDLNAALERLNHRPIMLELNPQTFDDALGAIWDVGEQTGAVQEAIDLLVDLHLRTKRIEEWVAHAERPRVLVLEWLDPPYTCGQWVPELIEKAGGLEVLARPGEPCRPCRWQEIVEARPEVLLLAPTGFSPRQALARAPRLFSRPGWIELPAVRRRRVHCLDATRYLTRPGPQLVDALEQIAHLLHPERCPRPMSAEGAVLDVPV